MNAWHLIDQLVQQGVTHFCIAPGSRSTPLVIAAASHPRAKTFVHFDERGLGFYALGLAKGVKKPVAIIVTSGTAVANLLPAVLEAYYSEEPLIILSADRPHELRECGANQTCSQMEIFSQIRWKMDLAPHLKGKDLRSMATQAVFHAMGNPKGPVQLNCPFQEPFETDFDKIEGTKDPLQFATLQTDPLSLPFSRGLILLGKVDNPLPVLEMGKRLGWPIYIDLLSNGRAFSSQERIFSIPKESPKPECILHLGQRLTEKKIPDLFPDVPWFHISPSPFLQNPSRRKIHRIQSDIAPFCNTFEAKKDPSWLFHWQRISPPFEKDPLFSCLPFRPIFFGNSTIIRRAEKSSSLHPQVFANRGLSGIDGNIATIAGIYDALQEPIIGIIGDQTALHDLNSFSLLKNKEILLIVLNNRGGRIFEELPIRTNPFLSTHFIVEHPWNFQKIAEMFFLPYCLQTEIPEEWPLAGVLELQSTCVSTSSTAF